MQEQLIDSEPQTSKIKRRCLQAITIVFFLVLAYGLMVFLFYLCLLIEHINSELKAGYELGGAIILSFWLLAAVTVVVIGCWTKKRRDSIREAMFAQSRQKRLQQISKIIRKE